MYHPDFEANSWQLLLIFYTICLIVFVICAFGNKFLPMVDTICAAWTAVSILIILIALSVKADVGRHSASYALGHYDTSFSGWGGFTFFIGLLPAAYTFSAIGMISSMAEEVSDPAVKGTSYSALGFERLQKASSSNMCFESWCNRISLNHPDIESSVLTS